MKLLLCLECHDIFKLDCKERACKCGKTQGMYQEDGLNANYRGPCIPLGFANSSLVSAIRNQPEAGLGERFEAFVIPKKCPTMNRV